MFRDTPNGPIEVDGSEARGSGNIGSQPLQMEVLESLGAAFSDPL